MSYGWTAWTWKIDEELKRKDQQIDALAAELKKKDEHIEKLEVQSMDLQERLRALEDATQPVHAKVEWLFELKMDEKKKFQSEGDSSELSKGSISPRICFRDVGACSSKPDGTMLALHGGYLEPELLTIPIPFKDPTFSNGAMVFPEPPTLEHGESMKMCVENGWHTVHFNKGLLRSQVNSGTPFIQGDKKQCFSPLLSKVVIARKSDCTILRDVASSSCTLASVPLQSLCLGQKPPLHVVRVSMQVAELLVKGCTKRLGVAGVQLKGNILGGLDEFPGRQWLRSTRKAFARENVQIAVRDHGYDDPWSKRFKIPNDYRPVSKGVFMKGGHPHDPVTIINSYACSHHLRSKNKCK